MQVIDNVFQIHKGDVVQICEDNHWSDLGVINDPNRAKIELNKDNFTILGKPARVIRK